MRKSLVAAAVSAALLAPAGAMAQVGTSLSGTWTGTVVQTFDDGTTAQFTAMIALRADGTAESAYPSDACGGTLTLISRKGAPQFSEHITYGGETCADGTITLTLAGDTLEYHWQRPGSGTAVGTLRPTDKTIPPAPTP